jgi:hypothetical protein
MIGFAALAVAWGADPIGVDASRAPEQPASKAFTSTHAEVEAAAASGALPDALVPWGYDRYGLASRPRYYDAAGHVYRRRDVVVLFDATPACDGPMLAWHHKHAASTRLLVVATGFAVAAYPVAFAVYPDDALTALEVGSGLSPLLFLGFALVGEPLEARANEAFDTALVGYNQAHAPAAPRPAVDLGATWRVSADDRHAADEARDALGAIDRDLPGIAFLPDLVILVTTPDGFLFQAGAGRAAPMHGGRLGAGARAFTTAGGLALTRECAVADGAITCTTRWDGGSIENRRSPSVDGAALDEAVQVVIGGQSSSVDRTFERAD